MAVFGFNFDNNEYSLVAFKNYGKEHFPHGKNVNPQDMLGQIHFNPV